MPEPVSANASASKLGDPARRGRGLANGLVEALGARLSEQAIRPGDKLPSESEIMQTYGVSRSVVREALSKLQAAGLVETHHGIGTFALEPRRAGSWLPGTTAGGLDDMLALLELRLGLESESAGLAAMRRDEAQLQAMRSALDEFASHLAAPGDTVSPDYRFHLAIANATGNAYLAHLMAQLGPSVIPRTRVSSTWLEQHDQPQHLLRVHQEHQQIYDAIARRDSESARAAMRIHLINSRERQRAARPGPQLRT